MQNIKKMELAFVVFIIWSIDPHDLKENQINKCTEMFGVRLSWKFLPCLDKLQFKVAPNFGMFDPSFYLPLVTYFDTLHMHIFLT